MERVRGQHIEDKDGGDSERNIWVRDWEKIRSPCVSLVSYFLLVFSSGKFSRHKHKDKTKYLPPNNNFLITHGMYI